MCTLYSVLPEYLYTCLCFISTIFCPYNVAYYMYLVPLGTGQSYLELKNKLFFITKFSL